MKIIHLSDLHFGTQDAPIVESLQSSIKDQNPDLIIISGDFTQIGNRKEFAMAHDFLSSLSAPYLCVPGNHDVPAVNLWARFLRPYKNYRHYISQDLDAVFQNEEVNITGINSARRALPHWNWANGAVSNAQRDFLRETLPMQEKRWKIAVLHHPVHKVHQMPIDVTVFGRKRTLQTLLDQRVDLILTGHVHHASITTIGNSEHQNVFLSASTALSSRKRGQENGFNIIHFGKDHFDIEVMALKGGRFKSLKSYRHKKLRE